MKLYDKESLFMLVLDFGLIALALWDFWKRGPAARNIAILLYSCMGVKTNFRSAFSDVGSKKRKNEIRKVKTAYKNVFGRFAPLAPFSFFIMLAIGLLLLKIMEGKGKEYNAA